MTGWRRVGGLSAAVASALVLAACTGSSPSPIESPSPSGGVLQIGADASWAGTDPLVARSTNQMLRLYLEQVDATAGDYTVRLVEGAAGASPLGLGPEALCAANAQAHADRAPEVAILGLQDALCTQTEVPLLNEAPGGPLSVVSPVVSYPGLTQPWQPGEPDSFYPSGRRSFARVVTTDDRQGAALASYAAANLGLKKCAVLNDGQPDSQGVVLSFVDQADREGLEVLSNDTWDPLAPDYTDLFEQIKAKDPDCVMISGSFAGHGQQLMRDKVAVLGDNRAVRLLAPYDFLGSPGAAALPEAQGAAVPGMGWSLDQLVRVSPEAAALVQSYRTRYGEAPASAESLYAVAALQVVLAAIEGSDGTRAGVTDQIFGGRGITIPKEISVLGRDLTINPETGDANLEDLTVYRIVDGLPALGTAVSSA